MNIQEQFDSLIVPAIKKIEAEYPHLKLNPSFEYTETGTRAILDIQILDSQHWAKNPSMSIIIPLPSNKDMYFERIRQNLISMWHIK